MKKILAALLSAIIAGTVLTGCSGGFDITKPINVVTRESGSGTRGAFVELFDLRDGGTDLITKEAEEVNKTDVVLTNIAGNPHAIGYVSMGSLNDTVKALEIDGIKATTANVTNGTYPVKRPFIIAYVGELDGLQKDFVEFILSSQGQAVIAADYVAAVSDAQAFAGTRPAGRIVVSGSSSVSPVMEKLIEAYKTFNSAAVIELQTTDSSAGMNAAADGVCDIGMSSRDLRESELEKLTGITIAIDGIAVIVNTENTLAGMTKAQVKSVYLGETVTWNEIK